MYSADSTSLVIPPSSENLAVCPLLSIWNTADVSASVRVVLSTAVWRPVPMTAMACCLPVVLRVGSLLQRGAVRHLLELEHDELRRFHRRDADLDGEDAEVEVLPRVVLGVALDPEGLRRRHPEQRVGLPDSTQKHRDGAAHPVPERWVVGLEDHPVRAEE